MDTERVSTQASSSRNSCAVADCRDASAATLDSQPLCLDHFFSRCYEALECFEGRRDPKFGARESDCAQLRRFLEECSTQALNVCLRNENLNNLQRSRLLDVLLWAGELSECVSATQEKLNRGLGGREPASARTSEAPTNS